jgi:cytochrome c553
MNRTSTHRFANWRVSAVCCFGAFSLQAHPQPYPAFYPADASRGQALSASCLACHGSTPLTFGNVPYHAPKLGGQRASSIFDGLMAYKNRNRRSSIMMPIAAALTIQDMRDVSAYLAGTDIKPSFEPVPDSWARTRVLEDCAACHGETGLGVMHGLPVIGGQYQDYLVHALQGYKNGERTDPTMVVMARKLSDEQIRQLAAYFDYFSERSYLRAAQ